MVKSCFDQMPDMTQTGRAIANLMGMQAATRQLKPGETRQLLAHKCLHGVSSLSHMSFDVKVAMFLKQMAAN